jgi:ATP-binding cassette subfamily F protein 3
LVGDNGQGKTTFLRTVVDSLSPISGHARWGYGCEIGVYAQHVYTSLPDKRTVLEYLEDRAAPGTKSQAILDLAGSFLFRGDHVNKHVKVLSGGERARLCLAGLLLSKYNVLVLDEPGNHLDVDTVEALAEALLDYKGTVLFTSHDRHFMHRVANCVIEVRDGGVTNYRGDYDSYLYFVNKEIDDGERETAAASKAAPGKLPKPDKGHVSRKDAQKGERELRKEMTNVERKIATLDSERRTLNTQYQSATDPKESLQLHEQVAKISGELTSLEERWCELQQQIEGEG